MQPDEALASLSKNAAQIINEEELRQKLALGRPLRVKLGESNWASIQPPRTFISAMRLSCENCASFKT